ncbi:MAG TPA: hypothetical protein DCF44_11680 [Chitinophagaceae bacterium]|nr:hypothetical protein [Chitinophagaceae bacterium]
MIRFIFGLALAYFVLRIVRLVIDPIFDKKAPPVNPNSSTPNNAAKKSKIGEYVDYEEVR